MEKIDNGIQKGQWSHKKKTKSLPENLNTKKMSLIEVEKFFSFNLLVIVFRNCLITRNPMRRIVLLNLIIKRILNQEKRMNLMKKLINAQSH